MPGGVAGKAGDRLPMQIPSRGSLSGTGRIEGGQKAIALGVVLGGKLAIRSLPVQILAGTIVELRVYVNPDTRVGCSRKNLGVRLHHSGPNHQRLEPCGLVGRPRPCRECTVSQGDYDASKNPIPPVQPSERTRAF